MPLLMMLIAKTQNLRRLRFAQCVRQDSTSHLTVLVLNVEAIHTPLDASVAILKINHNAFCVRVAISTRMTVFVF